MEKEYPFKIAELVKNAGVVFSHYRNQHLYYTIMHFGPDEGAETPEIIAAYHFPIPLEDLGNATVKVHEKAITLMRYIRKAMEEGTLVKI